MTSKIDPKLFDDGRPVRKSDLRDTLGQIRSEIDHGGYYRPAIEGARPRSVADRLGDMISVKDFGAVGDGKTDDAPAFQAAIDAGYAIFVPRGTYKIKSSLIIGDKAVYMHGEFGGRFSHGDTPVRPELRFEPDDNDTDEPLIHRAFGYIDKDGKYTGQEKHRLISFGFSNLAFSSKTSYGSCVDFHSMVDGYIENCLFNGAFRGLTLGESCFDIAINNVKARQGVNAYKKFGSDYRDDERWINGSWGISVTGHTFLTGINVQGFATGVQIVEKGSSLFGCRIEVARVGIKLGDKKYGIDGTPDHMAKAVQLAGISTEACLIGIHAKWIKGVSISGVDIQGSVENKAWGGKAGLWIENATNNCQFSGICCWGWFSQGAIVNDSKVPVWRGTGQSPNNNDVAGVFRPLLKDDDEEPHFHFVGTQAFSGAIQDRYRTMTAFHDLMLPGLTGLNIKDLGKKGSPNEGGPVFAKNLGGVAHPDADAASVEVTFFPHGGTINDKLLYLYDPRVVADESSALEPGDYVYVSTWITEHCEIYLNKKEVTVKAGERVEIPYDTRDWMKARRIYRGPQRTKEGRYEANYFEGFWEIDNSTRPFVDDGKRPFDGQGAPRLDNTRDRMPSRTEDDANYQIVATPSWHTTVIVTNKERKGFRLEFGTPAPDDEQTVSWLLFRP
ncbi:MAG: glycosyl hydrolase family 28-related protein [Alphaproteobacteria bacterium]